MKHIKMIVSVLLILIMTALFLTACASSDASFDDSAEVSSAEAAETTSSSAGEKQPAAPASSDSNESFTDVVILSTSDIHGKCWETNILTDRPETHNMLRISTAVRELRETYGEENVLLIDNGDLFQGTQISELSVRNNGNGTSPELLAEDSGSGASSDVPVMALCLKEIGYDAFELGNHEFNFPWENMKRTYDWLEKNGIPVLGANVCYDGSLKGTHAGENAFTPYITRTITVNGHAHKIGILGLTNSDITRWDLSGNYPGLQFAHPGNEDYSMTAEANLYIPRMKEEGCEFIILSYHGGMGNTDGELSFGVNTEDQGMRLIAESHDIDLLINGHDHLTNYSNQTFPNADGREITVVNCGGQELTHTVFRFTEDESGALTFQMMETENLDPGDYEPDEALMQAVEPYAVTAAAYVEKPLGTITGEWDGNRDFYLSQTDTIDFVSKACIEMTTAHLAEIARERGEQAVMDRAGTDHLDVDLCITSVTVSPGFVLEEGPISIKDTYRLYRFANNILVVPMTGSKIRAIAEENAAQRLTARIHGGEVHYYTTGDQYTNVLFGGLNFVYDMSASEGERVRIDSFSNGRKFEDDAVYLTAVNNYMLGNDGCGLRDFSSDDAIWSQQADENGAVVQDMIGQYVERRQEEGSGITPEEIDWHWEITYTADPKERTVSEAEGKAFAELVEKPEDGGSYVIFHEADECTMTAEDAGGGLTAAPWKAYGSVLTEPVPEGALIFTAHVQEDGTYRFADQEGRWLTCSQTGSVALEASPDMEEMSRWRLEEADGGWYIVNAGAGNDRALQYSEDIFSTYGLDRLGAYIFGFYKAQSD